MPELTASLIQDLGSAWYAIRVWYEALLPWLKIISLAVSALFVYGTLYAIFKSGYNHWYADRIIDKVGKKDLAERRARRSWARAVRLIQNRVDKTKWIEALKEADRVMQEGLKIKGYQALNAEERSGQAGEEIAALHETYKITADNPESPLTHEEAVRTLRHYKKIIKELGLCAADRI